MDERSKSSRESGRASEFAAVGLVVMSSCLFILEREVGEDGESVVIPLDIDKCFPCVDFPYSVSASGGEKQLCNYILVMDRCNVDF